MPSDLHYSQIDSDVPEMKRRVEVSVQQVITDAAGEFAGVLRVGLLAKRVDQRVQGAMNTEEASDTQRVFICDEDGRLITRITATDELKDFDGDLRVAPEHLPEEIARALSDRSLRDFESGKASRAGHFNVGGVEYLTTFRALPKGETQDWIVGIVVPRAFYLGPLTAMRERLLAVSLGIIIAVVIAGGLILRGFHRGHRQIVRETLRMNAFEFSPAPTGLRVSRRERDPRKPREGEDRDAGDGEVCAARTGPPTLPGKARAGARRRAAGDLDHVHGHQEFHHVLRTASTE